jgi:drug/metabolite transporter (DMT)-like permease
MAGGGALLLWGGTAVANKIAVGHMDAMTAGVLRSLLAGLIAAGIAVVWRLPFPKPARQRGLLVLSGITSFAVWPLLLSLGLGLTTASHAALIMAMIPVFTGLIAAGFERNWPRAGWWIGIAIAVVGAFFLVFYRGGGALLTGGGSVTGDLIILSGAGICALGYVAGGKLTPVIGTWSTTFWGLAIATVVLIPTFALLAPRTDWSAVGIGGWGAIAYLTFMSSLLGYAGWFWALGHGGIARIGSWQLAQPVITLALAVMVLGETLTWPLLVAASAILVGTAIAQRRIRSIKEHSN